ncbi:MAG: ATP-binding protein [Burkholderiales bacterium]|jgi:signal transduction histidine kinase|nr:ATP-binding protein [Burkholderiales bacterium]
MWQRSPLFRTYALWLAGIAGGAVLMHGLIQAAIAFNDARELTIARQRAEAALVVERLGRVVGRVEDRVVWIAGLIQPSSAVDWAALRQEVQVALAAEPSLVEVRVVDAAGRVCLIARRHLPDQVGCEERSTAMLPQAQTAQYGPVDFWDDRAPTFTVGLRPRGAAAAAVVSEIALTPVWDVVAGLPLTAGGTAFVVDTGGRLIAHSDLALVLRRIVVDADTGAKEGPSLLAAHALDSTMVPPGRVIRSQAIVPGADWRVFVEAPGDRLLEPVYATLRQSLLVVALAVGAALAAALVLSARLTAPIRALRDEALRFGKGEFDRRLAAPGNPELRPLADAMNAMAAQLQDYTGSLERKVAEKTAEIETANRHKSEFLANVSHELRTPLNAILGFSEALDERLFGELNARQAQYVRDIHDSGRHLLALINDLLDLSKVEAGRLDLEPAPVDVPALVEGAMQMVAARASAAGVRLTVDIEPDVGVWRGDARRLHQILLNLLSNAVKFTPAGGDVRVRAAHAAGGLAIAVADTGVGIAPEQMQRLFAPFAQARSRGLRGEEGTGLGLALSRRLAELHGGRLQVDSAPGRGSTFTLWLPAQAPMEAA